MTDNMELVYLAAFRYALGRMTYIVDSIIHELIIAELSDETKKLMVREIKEALAMDHTGAECDKKNWIRLKDKLVKELTT